MGIISLPIYYWIFIIKGYEQKNLALAGFSQWFSAPLSFITAKIGVLFEKVPNEITQTTSLVMQISGLLLMMIVFFIGYSYKRYHSKKHNI